MIDKRWNELSEKDWKDFAEAWVAKLNGFEAKSIPELPQLFEDDPNTDVNELVVIMNFTAPHESQWKFINIAFECANNEALAHLAAGPVEHLLGNHGSKYIDQFETIAKKDIRFAKMLGGCYQYQMTEDIWERICAVRHNQA